MKFHPLTVSVSGWRRDSAYQQLDPERVNSRGSREYHEAQEVAHADNKMYMYLNNGNSNNLSFLRRNVPEEYCLVRTFYERGTEKHGPDV